MPNCPRDSSPLEQQSESHAAMWRCGTCFGGFFKAPPGKSLAGRNIAIPREEWDPQIHCPEDGTETSLVEIGGVAIDFCPKCNGVWLDDGEIEKVGSIGLPGTPSSNQFGTATGIGVTVASSAVIEFLFGV